MMTWKFSHVYENKLLNLNIIFIDYNGFDLAVARGRAVQ